jgi:hypothetical protein
MESFFNSDKLTQVRPIAVFDMGPSFYWMPMFLSDIFPVLERTNMIIIPFSD